MFFLWVETGVPGVKPPEPVIEVVRHQCLTHKVVHLLVYSFVCTHLTFCLSLACGTKPSLGPNLELTSLGFFVKVLKDQPIENCSDFAGVFERSISLRDCQRIDSSFWEHLHSKTSQFWKFDGPPRRSWKSRSASKFCLCPNCQISGKISSNRRRKPKLKKS